MEPLEVTVCRAWKPPQFTILSQTCLVKEQSLHKCVVISVYRVTLLARIPIRPFFNRLSAVRIFIWRRVHAKKRHLGSVFALQIGLIFSLFVYPQQLNKISALSCIFSVQGPAPNDFIFSLCLYLDIINCTK
jgi:hypothetical protein